MQALTAEGHRIRLCNGSSQSKYFTTLPEPKTISNRATSCHGSVCNPTTEQIYERADRLNWDLCPAEVGPHLRLAYKDQPMNEWLSIAMIQIADRNGRPNLFDVERNDHGSWLDTSWAEPADPWNPDNSLVFSPRK